MSSRKFLDCRFHYFHHVRVVHFLVRHSKELFVSRLIDIVGFPLWLSCTENLIFVHILKRRRYVKYQREHCSPLIFSRGGAMPPPCLHLSQTFTLICVWIRWKYFYRRRHSTQLQKLWYNCFGWEICTVNQQWNCCT